MCISSTLRLSACALLLALSACSDTGTQPESSTSVLIQNARIVDGMGLGSFSGGLRIEDGLIVAVGNLSPRPGETIVDAEGMVLSPGFIDTHSHHDDGLEENRDALPLLTQGITTAVFGQDGFHNYPIGNLLGAFDAAPAAINIASYAGHNTLRTRFMAEPNRQRASASELEQMKAALQVELDSGALGLSSGLEYEPGMYSLQEEVIALARVAAAAQARYSSHIRSEDRYVFEAIEELLRVARETGIPVHYSHMKLAGKAFWDEAANVRLMLDEARQQGQRVTGDIYPYLYWGSTIFVLLPDRDPDNLEEIEFVLSDLAPADGIIFTRFEPNPAYVGLSIADISRQRETPDALTMSSLMKEALAWSEANGGRSAESIMGRSMQEADIADLITWPHGNITSDGGYAGHPRGRGAFPRVLKRYVRELEVLSLEEAVRKMSSQAATSLGLSDRGRLAPGMKADLVLFDPDTIADRATVDDPALLSVGVISVWVNGELVYHDGATTSARPGQVLRRQPR